jgi:hypothetical protein
LCLVWNIRTASCSCKHSHPWLLHQSPHNHCINMFFTNLSSSDRTHTLYHNVSSTSSQTKNANVSLRIGFDNTHRTWNFIFILRVSTYIDVQRLSALDLLRISATAAVSSLSPTNASNPSNRLCQVSFARNCRSTNSYASSKSSCASFK